MFCYLSLQVHLLGILDRIGEMSDGDASTGWIRFGGTIIVRFYHSPNAGLQITCDILQPKSGVFVLFFRACVCRDFTGRKRGRYWHC